MTAYDVLDEATIAATPAEIVQALLDEAAGRSHWWQPYLRIRQRGNRPPTQIGAVVDITVNAGGLARRWAAVSFSGRVTAFEPERRLVLDYFDGRHSWYSGLDAQPGRCRAHAHRGAVQGRPARRDAAEGQVRGRAQHQLQGHARRVPRDRAIRRRE